MLYFKNTELAKNHHVTLRTVLNWIQSAKEGKLDLDLHTEKDKTYIANTARNIAAIETMVEERRKYRNTRGFKAITPKPEFYELYNQQQIFDIISNLDIHREIPFQYGYFDGGASYWDSYAERLAAEEKPNFLTSTIQLLDLNHGYVDCLLSRYRRVNVVDIGVGNAMPVKALLQHLIDQGKFGRYIAVDISASMLEIAKRNLNSWFGDKVPFVACEADINYDRFARLLAEEAVGESADDTVNLVLALGGTFANLRLPDRALQVIHGSMNRNDLLIHNLKLDSEAARQYFDFRIGEKRPPLDAKAKMIVDLLNIDESFYDVEMGYDASLRQRYIRIRLRVALTIKFSLEKGDRFIELNKDDTILLWRYWHQTAKEVINQFDRNDFYLLQTSQTEDQEYMLTVSRVKRESRTAP